MKNINRLTVILTLLLTLFAVLFSIAPAFAYNPYADKDNPNPVEKRVQDFKSPSP